MGMIGSVTSKGQTTVPKEVRDRLGLERGARIEWTVEEMDQAIMEAVAEDDARIQREWHDGTIGDDSN